jgi:hypothetical protein
MICGFLYLLKIVYYLLKKAVVTSKLPWRLKVFTLNILLTMVSLCKICSEKQIVYL